MKVGYKHPAARFKLPRRGHFFAARLRKSVGLFINLQEAYAPSLLQSSIPLESSLLLPSLLANTAS